MDTKFNNLPEGENRIVYVRPVNVADLPDDVRAQAGDLTIIYALHRPDGARLALVRDCGLAFAFARHHDLAPVHVH